MVQFDSTEKIICLVIVFAVAAIFAWAQQVCRGDDQLTIM